MEIIDALNKLEIETIYSSSSQDVEEEVKRNWLELPADVMSLILLKLGTIDILCSAQWVCSSWWKLSKQPHLFRSIHVKKVHNSVDFGSGCQMFSLDSTRRFSSEIAREAIDRSCGQLIVYSVRAFRDDELLQYMSEKSTSLRSLRLAEICIVDGYDSDDYCFKDYGFIKSIAEKLPHLEELGIIKCPDMSNVVIETFGRLCPQLKSCRLNLESWEREFEEMALGIAENMPQLQHLNISGNEVTNNALKVILDGCPHLESLDLRRCSRLYFDEDLKQRCGYIKKLMLPTDPSTDSDEYYESDDDYEADEDYEYGQTNDYDQFFGFRSD